MQLHNHPLCPRNQSCLVLAGLTCSRIDEKFGLRTGNPSVRMRRLRVEGRRAGITFLATLKAAFNFGSRAEFAKSIGVRIAVSRFSMYLLDSRRLHETRAAVAVTEYISNDGGLFRAVCLRAKLNGLLRGIGPTATRVIARRDARV